MNSFNQKNQSQSINATQASENTNKCHGYTLPKYKYRGRQSTEKATQQLSDYGPYPFVVDIDDAAKRNTNFRTVLWTGQYMQLTLMNIPPGGEIGLEKHDTVDQFIHMETGRGLLMMGDSPDTPDFRQTVNDDASFIVPAGKWHNLMNIGQVPIKLYSIYAPPQHPFGTVYVTKADADAAKDKRNF